MISAAYNDTFEKVGGRCLHPPRRACGRRLLPARRAIWSDAGTAARSRCSPRATPPRRPREYAQVVAQRVRDLLMHHPRAGSERYVTISAGVASLVPPRELPLGRARKACSAALKRAKKLRQEQRRHGRGGGLQIAVPLAACRAGLLLRRHQRDHPECRMVEVVALVEAHAPALIRA